MAQRIPSYDVHGDLAHVIFDDSFKKGLFRQGPGPVLLILLCILVLSCEEKQTPPATVPEVVTSIPTNITSTSSTVGGNIIANGGAAIIDAGVVLSSTNAQPTFADEKHSTQVSSGDFEINLTGLSSGTSYYVRAFAANSVGAVFGEVVIVTTGNMGPELKEVQVHGDATVGQKITASYLYSDAESDEESGTTFQWYSAADATGNGEVEISGTDNHEYTVTQHDVARFVRVGIIPKAAKGTSAGAEVKSNFIGPINERQNVPPEALAIAISGSLGIHEILSINYSYMDLDDDPEEGSTITWYRADDQAGANETEVGPSKATHKIETDDIGKFFRVTVTPKASRGVAVGQRKTSSFVGPIEEVARVVAFRYNGLQVTYGTMTSMNTGRLWLDRNLGASAKPVNGTDHENYGDLFQWGRGSDGHQLINHTSSMSESINPTSSELSPGDMPGNALFIVSSSNPFDWRSPQNSDLWQGVSGVNNPCPAGYRIPTKEEWLSEKVQSLSDGYDRLNLTADGLRLSSDGTIVNDGATGYYWSSTASGTATSHKAILFTFFSGTKPGMGDQFRSAGASCRCIKD